MLFTEFTSATQKTNCSISLLIAKLTFLLHFIPHLKSFVFFNASIVMVANPLPMLLVVFKVANIP